MKNTYLSYPSYTILNLLQRPCKLCSQLYLLSWLISCYETTCKGSNLGRYSKIMNCKLYRKHNRETNIDSPLNINSMTRSSSPVSIKQAARPLNWTTPSASVWPSFFKTHEQFLSSSWNFCSWKFNNFIW